MFTISNVISYDNLMVQGINKKKVYGSSNWLHVSGKANDKFVKEQATLLVETINEKLQHNPALKDEIYVISPFKNVAYQLDRKSTRLNSSHVAISYAVFCLKKKNNKS